MSPYRGSHERENAADWTLFSSVDYTEQDRFLTPNVEYEHGYDQDITPLSVDDAAEIGYNPGAEYDYPDYINKWEDDDDDWWK